MSTETTLRHNRSKKDFPFLSLEPDEYVALSISRSKYGLILIWFAEIVGFLALTLVLIILDSPATLAPAGFASPVSLIRPVIFALYFVLILTGLIGTKVYLSNKLYITNRRAIQISSNALFHESTNIIELSRIEDVSFTNSGLFDAIFHIGTIRMSTVGDETTYTFPFVDTPRDEIDLITHLVHENKK